MKKADAEKIIRKFEKELKLNIRNVEYLEIIFKDWKKQDKNRTYINIRISIRGRINYFRYNAGYINNLTNRYSAKHANVDINKKDFSYIINEIQKYNISQMIKIKRFNIMVIEKPKHEEMRNLKMIITDKIKIAGVKYKVKSDWKDEWEEHTSDIIKYPTLKENKNIYIVENVEKCIDYLKELSKENNRYWELEKYNVISKVEYEVKEYKENKLEELELEFHEAGF